MKNILIGIALLMLSFPVRAISYQGLPLLVSYQELTRESQRQVSCLAENIYFEAASENIVGKVAVAYVTINRVISGMFANTVCGVVYQKINGVCQFAWYCDDSLVKRKQHIKNTLIYKDILKLALEIITYYHLLDDVTKGATFFHNTSVNPRWKLYKTTQIGNHIFYRHTSREIAYNRRIHIH